tara:strand:- start:1353 stop:1979 length:627 start_codon:yes stop_codon:yes gene_type:complete
MDPFIGEIVMFAGNFPPRDWAYCDGQLLAIASNTPLFSIIGTTYGGDGRTTFALPDLRGRAPIHQGHGPGLSTRPIGQRSGEEMVTLNVTQMPSHTHTITSAPGAITGTGSVDINAITGGTTQTDNPDGAYWAQSPSTGAGQADSYEKGTPNAKMAQDAASLNLTGLALDSSKVSALNNGGNQSHTNMQPYLVISFIICLQGTFPSRN